MCCLGAAAKATAAKRISCLKKAGCYQEAKRSCIQFQKFYGAEFEDDHGVGEILESINKVMKSKVDLSDSSMSDEHDERDSDYEDEDEDDGSDHEGEHSVHGDEDASGEEVQVTLQEAMEEETETEGVPAEAERDGAGGSSRAQETQEEGAGAHDEEDMEEDQSSRRVRRRKLVRVDSDPGPKRPAEESNVVKRFAQRYVGHTNMQTDIKEAVFMGPDDEYVVTGSDDGRAFIYDRSSGQLLRVLGADEAIVNCVQPHPHDFVLATSGIESTVKLWSPIGRHGMRGRSRAAAPAREDMQEGDETDEGDSSDEDLDMVMSRNHAERSERGHIMEMNLDYLRRFLARVDPGTSDEGMHDDQPVQCAQQ